MLNDTQLKNLKPKDKNYLIADSGGLSIEITIKGVNLWRYRFRLNNNKICKVIF